MTHSNLGKQLKNIRTERGMTLDDVAAETGVSKPMLGQIERGQSSPTINTLWKIATGLKTPLSFFLQENKAEYSVADFKNSNAISEENGSMRAYTMFSYDPIRNFEAFYIEFDSGCRHVSSKHDNNVEELIFIVKGKLTITLNEEKITLSENQAIRFSANVEHAYCNTSDSICCVYNVIFY